MVLRPHATPRARHEPTEGGRGSAPRFSAGVASARQRSAGGTPGASLDPMPRTSTLIMFTGALLGVAALLIHFVVGNTLMAGLVMLVAVVDVALGVMLRNRLGR